MFYVTMTDRFMSGWGMAKDVDNKVVVFCDTYEEAEIVEANASARSEMKYVNIRSTRPYYKNAYVSYYNKADQPLWFKPNMGRV